MYPEKKNDIIDAIDECIETFHGKEPTIEEKIEWRMKFGKLNENEVEDWKKKYKEGKAMHTKGNAKLKIINHIRNMFKDVIPNEQWRNGFVGFAEPPKPGVQGWYSLLHRDIHISNETIMFENVFLFYYLMVHEYTHLINDEFGVEDVEENGWHNELYRDSIKNLFGVKVSLDGKYGYQKFDVKQVDFYVDFARWYDLNKMIWDEVRELFYECVREIPIPKEKTLDEQVDEFDEKMDEIDQYDGDMGENTPEDEREDVNPDDYNGKAKEDEEKKKKDYEVVEDDGVDLF